MTIDSLRDLKKLLKVCQDAGVTAIEVDNIKLNLTLKPKSRVNALDAFPEASVRVPTYTPIQVQESQDEAISAFNEGIDEPDDLTEDELLFYSVKPEPGSDTKQ